MAMTYQPLTEHDPRCIADVECVVRDELRDALTAPTWDAAAMDAECAYVTEIARAWLDEGTATCWCREHRDRDARLAARFI
jgi:hypothetical protein